MIEGFEPRTGELDRGLLVLTFKTPLNPPSEAQLLAALMAAGITPEVSAPEERETTALTSTCFVAVPWLVPSRAEAQRQLQRLEGLVQQFGAASAYCTKVATALSLPDDDDEEDGDEQEEEESDETQETRHGEEDDEGGWRAGPPPGTASLPFPLENLDARLEEFDYEDWGIALKLAGPPVPGEAQLLRALHAFWLAPYRDPQREERATYRHADVAYDRELRTGLLWVDRFFVPVHPSELVSHLSWIAELVHRFLPVAHARFTGAESALKYAALTKSPVPLVLAGNPMRDAMEAGGVEGARRFAAGQSLWSARELAAMALELVYEVDPDDDPDEALARVELGLSFDPKDEDLASCKLEVLLRNVRVDEALRFVQDHPDAHVHVAQLGSLLRRERVNELRAVVQNAPRFTTNDTALTERVPRLLDLAPDLLPVLLKKLPPDEDIIPPLHALAHDLAMRDDPAKKDAAFVVFEAIFARPLPSPESTARENFLSAWNNACIHAHAAKRFELAARLADRAQPFVPENPFIAHSAACAYVAVGARDKALGQVRLAIDLGYEHLAKLETDDDLGDLRSMPEFAALFAAHRAKRAASRPAGVPEGATFSESDNEWVLAPRDAAGKEHGLVRYYRPEGTLVCETEFEHGTPHGKFRRVHPNGETSREGRFVHGKLEGTNVFHRSTEPTTEEFPHGLGEAVWRAELDYKDGAIVAGRVFDREGNRIREDGSKMPERPEGVPEDAHFGTDEGEDRWISGRMTDGGKRIGTWRFWDEEGALLSELSYERGELHGVARTFDPESGVATAVTYLHGRRVGDVVERYPEEGPGRLRRTPSGEMHHTSISKGRGPVDEHGKIGVWSFDDASGAFAVAVDLGVAPDPALFDEVLDGPARPAGAWRAVAERLARAGQHGVALFATARATAASGNPVELGRALAASTIPLGEEARVARAESALASIAESAAALGRNRTMARVARALLEGAEPALAFKLAAQLLDDLFRGPHAASDLIRAAIALAPERVELEQTHALVALSLGDPERAATSIKRLSGALPEVATALATYRAYLYPTFDFWPGHDEAARIAIEQPVDGDAPARDERALTAAIQEGASRAMLSAPPERPRPHPTRGDGRGVRGSERRATADGERRGRGHVRIRRRRPRIAPHAGAQGARRVGHALRPLLPCRHASHRPSLGRGQATAAARPPRRVRHAPRHPRRPRERRRAGARRARGRASSGQLVVRTAGARARPRERGFCAPRAQDPPARSVLGCRAGARVTVGREPRRRVTAVRPREAATVVDTL